MKSMDSSICFRFHVIKKDPGRRVASAAPPGLQADRRLLHTLDEIPGANTESHLKRPDCPISHSLTKAQRSLNQDLLVENSSPA